MRTLLLSSLFSAAAFAQVGGPLLGYVPDGAQLRPLYGLPAAGAIGAPIPAGRYSLAAVSPQQNYVLAAAAATGALTIVKPGTGSALAGVAETGPSSLVTSPHGTAAAAWFPASGHLVIVTGLPDAASARTVDAAFLNAAPLEIAVSDDGQWAAGLWGQATYAFGPDSQVIPLQTDPGVAALAFLHNSHSLALATPARATSIALGGNMAVSILGDYSSQTVSPKAIALSFDNSIAVVADASGAILTLAGGSVSTASCGCSPTGLYGMGRALFRLTGTSIARHPSELKLFDAAAGAVWIVPPALALAGGRQ